MHMADALLSQTVGGTMWAASAGTIAYCSAKVRDELEEKKVPLMGVFGAFLFAAQMINFTIPATGSSGHLCGGLLLAILLGSHAAFLTLSSVLVVQALFFADGGLLALGCNIFNIGFIPAFIVYPLVYQKLLGSNPGHKRRAMAIMVSSLVCLQLGSFGVVLETCLSGVSELPLSTFALFMQPIHLAIGLMEGAATVALVSFVARARPEMLQSGRETRPVVARRLRNLLVAVVAATVFTGGIVSWYSSENPDGLEWAIAKVTGNEELPGAEQDIQSILAPIQEKIALLSGYSFGEAADAGKAAPFEAVNRRPGKSRLGTSVAGICGAFMTLTLAVLGGYLLKRRAQTA